MRLTHSYLIDHTDLQNVLTLYLLSVKHVVVSVDLFSALSWLISKALWHVLTRDHTVLPATHTFIHNWSEPYLPLLPRCRVSLHFGWYSFPIPLRVGGSVSLGGLMIYWGGLSAIDHPSQPILRNTTSFSALTLLVGSFDPQKTSPKWPIMCLVGR